MIEIFSNLDLSNFSSLFEIAATLSLVYVVAERANQYGSTLAKNFFKSKANIESKFEERYNIIDVESVENMHAVVIGNGSTEGEIQRTKRNIYKLSESKNNKIEKLKHQREKHCVLSSFSFISCHMFLYSLFVLFWGGLNETPFMKSFLATFTCLSLLVLIIISIFGEKEKPEFIRKNLSLTKCCCCLIGQFLLSLVSYFYRNDIECYSAFYWTTTILLCVALPYMHFVVFMFIIHNRLNHFSRDLNTEFECFDKECKEVESHIHKLKDVYELSVSIESNNKDDRIFETVFFKTNKRYR